MGLKSIYMGYYLFLRNPMAGAAGTSDGDFFVFLDVSRS